MPWILFRHFFAELTKVLLLTTAVIVVVVAFGAVIKPLTGNLLGPGGILKYIALAMVPMLQFALPFSAGFAATIVSHRFASDNEFQAMAVSGISYRMILVPPAALGVVLTVFMFFLVQTAIPRFWGFMSDVITQDAAQVFVSTIRSGEAFRAGNFLIYADRIDASEPVDGGGMQRIRLEGVAAIEIDRHGKLETEFVARSGSADLYSSGSDLIVKVAFRDATVLRPGESTVAFMPRAEPTPTLIDRGWERSPKYLPWGELIEVIRDPSQGAAAVEARERLALAIAPARLIDRLHAQISQTGGCVLMSDEAQRAYEVRDAIVGGSGFIPRPPAKRITVIELEAGTPMREASAASAMLTGTSGSPGSAGSERLDLSLVDPKSRALGGSETRSVRWPTRIVGLAVANPSAGVDPNESLLSDSRRIAAQVAPPWSQYASTATSLLAGVDRATADTLDEALSHVWMRFAQPVSVALVLLLGAVLAIWRKHSLPLTIYLLAFVPAIANVLLIATGQSMIRGHQLIIGVIVMWLGNLLLGGLICSVGWRMARH
ncbi:MAG: LptF/LptG family permease [Phycisphaerales bacterium]|nr:LptF/LptG family permease [Phycisphaerales bacterium]